MDLLIIVLLVIAYLVIGWAVTAIGCMMYDGLYDEIEDLPVLTLFFSAFWPLVAVMMIGIPLIHFINPVTAVDRIRDWHERRQNVVVKGRRFRGKED